MFSQRINISESIILIHNQRLELNHFIKFCEKVMYISSNVQKELIKKKQRQSYDDTSVKKYPANKYYEFKDFVALENPRFQNQEPQIKRQKYEVSSSFKKKGKYQQSLLQARSSSLRNKQNREPECNRDSAFNAQQKGQQEPIYSLYSQHDNLQDKTEFQNKNRLNKKYQPYIQYEQQGSIYQPYNQYINSGNVSVLSKNLKTGKIKRKRIKSSNISYYNQGSTIQQSKIQSKYNKNSSRNKVKRHHYSKSKQLEYTSDVYAQLNHYKSLCLQIRKKNYLLNEQLTKAKDLNRNTLRTLQQKVEKLNESRKLKSQKLSQKQRGKSQQKMNIIYENIRSINKKLNKKPEGVQANYLKFYEFFIESMGVLEPSNSKIKPEQAHLLWKQILQFLISKEFKFKELNKIKTELKR